MQLFDGTEISERIKRTVKHFTDSPHVVWVEVSNQGGLKISKTIDLETNMEVSKVECILNAAAPLLFDILYHAEQESEWNIACLESSIVEEYNVQDHILYQSLTTGLPSPPLDFCVFRSCACSPDGKEFLLAFRSVIHQKVPVRKGYIRGELYPSGWILRKESEHKTLVTIICHLDLDAEALHTSKPLFLPANLSARLIPLLISYSQRPSLDLQKQYLTRIISRTYKEIADAFTCNLEDAAQWNIVSQQPNLAVWSKKDSRGLLSATGIFTIPISPKEAYEKYHDRMEKLDPLHVSSTNIEQIDENNRVNLVVWKSLATSDKLSDSAILLSSSKTLDGLYVILARSVIHNKAPPTSDKMRIELLPTGYFFHPIHGGKSCLVSYCVQVDMSPHMATGISQTDIEKAFIVRTMAFRNAIQTSASSSNKPKAHGYGKLALVSQLCTALVEEFDAKNRLNRQLRTLQNNQNENNSTSSPNFRKRKTPEVLVSLSEAQESGTGSENENENEEEFELPPIQQVLSLSQLRNTIRYPKKQFTFAVSRKAADEKFSYCCSSCYLEVMPNEILLHILFRLQSKDMCSISQVNKKFKFLAEDESLWKFLYQKKWIGFEELTSNEQKDKVEIEYDWKQTFKRRTITEYNWRHGKFQKLQLEGHQKGVKCMEHDDRFIISGSGDKLVKVWSTKSGELVKTFTGLNSGVISLSLNKDTVICGSKNGKMKCWNIVSGDCLWDKQFSFHSEGFKFVDDKVLSWDDTLEVWNITTGTLELSLNEHNKKINTVEVYNQYIASGSSDKTVKIWDLPTGKCIHTLNGHSAGINCLDIRDYYYVVSGANDKLIKLWDLRTRTCVSSYKGHLTPIKCVRMNESKIVSGASDNMIDIWDKHQKGECTPLLHLEVSSPVLCLQVDEKRVISGDNAGTVIVWDFGPVFSNANA